MGSFKEWMNSISNTDTDSNIYNRVDPDTPTDEAMEMDLFLYCYGRKLVEDYKMIQLEIEAKTIRSKSKMCAKGIPTIVPVPDNIADAIARQKVLSAQIRHGNSYQIACSLIRTFNVPDINPEDTPTMSTILFENISNTGKTTSKSIDHDNPAVVCADKLPDAYREIYFKFLGEPNLDTNV